MIKACLLLLFVCCVHGNLIRRPFAPKPSMHRPPLLFRPKTIHRTPFTYPHLTTPVYKTPIHVLLNGQKCIDRMPHPLNRNQYISCLSDNDYVIMDCPQGLVFNKYLDRCDYHANEMSPCASQPCAHAAKCIDLPNHKYKCECPKGYSGEKCQISPDICATNPCGLHGQCHTMTAHSPIPYYCTCFNDKFYGLTCSKHSALNPCVSSDSTEAYFKTKFDPSLFIHCDGHTLFLKACPKPLVFSTRDNICDWESRDKEPNANY
ncbi:slit -like protein [Brachionus plicatilis]|uniref:Slit-like protein n=1 Tax=Brachionus plicatilis TaxID=10195 RepID=A0A3M7QGH4_BRAPC|nr:slit -like protein [Brachionus plicatilis]